MSSPSAPMPVAQLFEQARHCLLDGRIEEAEAHCRRVLKLQPRNADALLVFALCRHDRGDFAGALKHLASALKLEPRSAALHVAYANSLRAVGKRESAIEHYTKAGHLNPNLVEADIGLGITLAEVGRYQQALASYQKVVNRRPDHVNAWLGISHSLLALDRPEEADRACLRILELQPNHVEAHTNRGVALLRLHRAREALSHLDRAIELSPAHPEASWNRAKLLIDVGRPLEAIATVDRVLRDHPRHGLSWHQKGRALARCQRLEEAIDCFRRASELEPADDAIRQEFAFTLALAGRAEDMLSVFDRSFEKRSNDAPGWTSRGYALAVLGRLEEARNSYEQALRIHPHQPVALLWRGYLDLLQGDLPSGWRGYEARWDDPLTRLRRRGAAPQWNGVDPLHGKILHVYHEQGLGDTLQFYRYLPVLAQQAGRVVFEAPKPLVGPLRRSLSPHIDIAEFGSPSPPLDFELPLLSAARVCGTTLETIPSDFPRVVADPQRVAIWNARLGPPSKLRVGIAWSGNPAHGNDAQRSIPLAWLQPLASLPVEWIGLQTALRDMDQESLATLPALIFPGEGIRDFEDTAALVQLCDVVVTVDTSAAHLAGAMGKPVWVMLPSLPDWRWLLGRTDSPWYPTARLFRQNKPGDWSDVIRRVAEELRAYSS